MIDKERYTVGGLSYYYSDKYLIGVNMAEELVRRTRDLTNEEQDVFFENHVCGGLSFKDALDTIEVGRRLSR